MRVFLYIILLLISSCSYGEGKVLPLKNWGLINVEDNSDINALKAWKIEKGKKNIVVAVIDTGIDPNHTDLRDNLWHDPQTPSVYGWNFLLNQPNPLDDNGHGDHVAGIIASRTDTIHGVSGVAPNVTIMPIKYYNEANSGKENLRLSIMAMNYAIDKGADIINFSGGGPDFSEEEYIAYKRAEQDSILVVTAAGNERQDIDNRENYYYPASYRLSNMISVMSTDIHNNVIPSSNWGKTKVDVAAPGEQIYSTLPGNRYGYMTGTSQATAFVSGIAALMLSNDKSLTPQQIKAIMIESVDHFPQLEDKNVSGGRVNAYSALMLIKKKKLAKTFKKCNSRNTNACKY